MYKKIVTIIAILLFTGSANAKDDIFSIMEPDLKPQVSKDINFDNKADTNSDTTIFEESKSDTVEKDDDVQNVRINKPSDFEIKDKHLEEIQDLPKNMLTEQELKQLKKITKKQIKSMNAEPNSKGFVQTAMKNDFILAKLFIKAGIDVNSQDKTGTTPLIWAAFNGNKDFVKLLLDNDANTNIANNEGFTALHAAVESGNPEILELLFTKNTFASPATVKDKTTPLHTACYNGNYKITKILLENNADIYAKTTFDTTPFVTAAFYKNTNLLPLLIEYKALKVNDDDEALKYNLIMLNYPPSDYKIFVEAGADVNTKSANGLTFLHSAVLQNDYKTVQYLIEHDAKINTFFTNESQEDLTPLHSAVMNNNKDITKLLIDNGAYVNAQEGILGFTPLHIAVLFGNIDIINYLLSENGEVNVVSKNGWTPLDLAYAKKNKELISILKEKSALNGKEVSAKLAEYGCSLEFIQDKNLYSLNEESALETINKMENDEVFMEKYKNYMGKMNSFKDLNNNKQINKTLVNIYPLLYGTN